MKICYLIPFLFNLFLIQSCTRLQEVPREPDWTVFYGLFGAAPSSDASCSFRGNFLEYGEKYSKGGREHAVTATEKYELLSLFSQRFGLEKKLFGDFDQRLNYIPGSVFISFQGKKAIVAFPHLSQNEIFYGRELESESGDFDCVDGAVYLKDVRDRSGGEGVDHSHNAVTALRLSEGGDLFIYHAQSPAPPNEKPSSLLRSYYLFKRVIP